MKDIEVLNLMRFFEINNTKELTKKIKDILNDLENKDEEFIPKEIKIILKSTSLSEGVLENKEICFNIPENHCLKIDENWGIADDPLPSWERKKIHTGKYFAQFSILPKEISNNDFNKEKILRYINTF